MLKVLSVLSLHMSPWNFQQLCHFFLLINICLIHLVGSSGTLKVIQTEDIILISALVGGSILLAAVLILAACLCMKRWVDNK